MEGKKSRHSAAGNKKEDRIWSASDLFDSLNHLPRNQDHHKELNSSEFLELLGKQGPPTAPAHFRTPTRNTNTNTTTGGSSSSKSPAVVAHNKDKDRNHNNYQSVAIDQCDITSSVDYGSRDYYQTSNHTSESTPYIRKENELDDLYKASTDTRGNWWQGSFYY